jgi:hypothetical protein
MFQNLTHTHERRCVLKPQVKLVDGSRIRNQCWSDLVVDNVAYDVGTRHVYFNAYNVTTSSNAIYQWGSAGGAVPVVGVKGVVEVAISAYSSLTHSFFLALQTNCPAGLCNQLITVSTTTASIVANVTVQPAIELLVVDNLQNLFLWGATSKFAAALSKVDYKTGKLSPPLYTSAQYSTNGGASAASSQQIFVSLLDFANGMAPAFAAINSKTGNVDVFTTTLDNNFPWTIAMAYL